jgi:hypothetical protein
MLGLETWQVNERATGWLRSTGELVKHRHYTQVLWAYVLGVLVERLSWTTQPAPVNSVSMFSRARSSGVIGIRWQAHRLNNGGRRIIAHRCSLYGPNDFYPHSREKGAIFSGAIRSLISPRGSNGRCGNCKDWTQGRACPAGSAEYPLSWIIKALSPALVHVRFRMRRGRGCGASVSRATDSDRLNATSTVASTLVQASASGAGWEDGCRQGGSRGTPLHRNHEPMAG